MERFFNTAGPMMPEYHYCIDPLTRLDWAEIQTLIRNMRYFVLHAPRQTGKTSTLFAMMNELNEGGQFNCAYTNVEVAQTARGDVTQGIPAICGAISSDLAVYLQDIKNRRDIITRELMQPVDKHICFFAFS